MSKFTKRKLAFSFVIGAMVITIAMVGFIFSKINIAEAADLNPCIPLKGKTTDVKVDGTGKTVTAPAGIANSGTIDFDNLMDIKDVAVGGKTYKTGVVIGVGQGVCVQKELDSKGKQTGNFILKGWEWDDNLGMISFYCNDTDPAPGVKGNNMGWDCDYDYKAVISAGGIFSATSKIYSSQVGLINIGGGTTSATGTTYSKLQRSNVTGEIMSAWQTRYGWSDSVGWLDFRGVIIPISGTTADEHDLDKDGYCAIGDGSCPGDKLPGDCNDNDKDINPGATDLIVGDKCIDRNCDGKCDLGTGDGTGTGGGCTGEGELCTVGKPNSVCERTGIKICVNGVATCNAVAGTPQYSKDLCSLGQDNNCDGKVEDSAPKCCVLGTVPTCPYPDFVCTSQKNGKSIVTSGNTQGEAVVASEKESPNKELIVRNVEKLKNYYENLGDVSNLNNSDVVLIENGNAILNDNYGFDTWGNSKTLVVVGGDVYIGSDFSSENNVQLGIIAMKNGIGGGNVYIGNNVRNLQVQIFADGGVYSYDENTMSKFATLEDKLWAQLVIQGSISSNDNTFGEASEYQDSNIWCLRAVKQIPTSGEVDPIIDASKLSGNLPGEASISIIYKPSLKDLPIFNGTMGSGISQGN